MPERRAPGGKNKQPKSPAHPPKEPSSNNKDPIRTGGPQFGQPVPSPDPNKFVVKHGSDTAAYKILDSQKQNPRPFPAVKGKDEPTLKLQDALGTLGSKIVSEIEKAGQLVFHAAGDTGSARGPRTEDSVADKMVADFDDRDPRAVPSFFYHLGDVVYSFGESKYYYDQFYDPYRNYPAPIFAIPGNHDGMVAPNSGATTLTAFQENFCAAGQPPHRTPESGELVRTAQIQPGVYFTLEAPFIRILGLYSNCLEDPGVISTENNTYPYVTDVQLTFLKTALARVKQEKFAGAVVIAVHHPPYVSVSPPPAAVKPDPLLHEVTNAGKHGGSPDMLKEIDQLCSATGVWPHAFLSGHAHNYQRFTRTKDGRQTPFVVAGNGGHALVPLTRKGTPALRTPVIEPLLSNGSDQVTFENYDDQEYGYLRVLANAHQLRIEYHPASDGARAKTPDDSVTVDLQTRKIVAYQPLPPLPNVSGE
jgi:hypothetical protein